MFKKRRQKWNILISIKLNTSFMNVTMFMNNTAIWLVHDILIKIVLETVLNIRDSTLILAWGLLHIMILYWKLLASIMWSQLYNNCLNNSYLDDYLKSVISLLFKWTTSYVAFTYSISSLVTYKYICICLFSKWPHLVTAASICWLPSTAR